MTWLLVFPLLNSEPNDVVSSLTPETRQERVRAMFTVTLQSN